MKLEDNGDLRLADAVNAAGGVTEFADTELVNLAEPLTDGAHIHIPTKEIILQESLESQISSTNSESDLVNINTADETELQKLYRVGPAIAKRIIEFREENGKFQSVEDIKKVRGIDERQNYSSVIKKNFFQQINLNKKKSSAKFLEEIFFANF